MVFRRGIAFGPFLCGYSNFQFSKFHIYRFRKVGDLRGWFFADFRFRVFFLRNIWSFPFFFFSGWVVPLVEREQGDSFSVALILLGMSGTFPGIPDKYFTHFIFFTSFD